MGQGFYVEIEKDKKYEGPFDALNVARAEARNIGHNLKIFHGILKESDTGDGYDSSELFIVPRSQK